MEDKKSFFEPFSKVRLITENETNKKFLKALSVVKEVCQDFGLLSNKAVKLTEAFKYAIMVVPLAVATPKSTLFPALRNYMISL